MRNFAVVCVTVAALVAGPAVAADLPQYSPPPAVPVDNGLGGAFYLRASIGLNGMWASNDSINCNCIVTTVPITGAGYGYSFGAGLGYEVGNGLRADLTVDQLTNNGLSDGTNGLELRSTIALANAYYDFGLGSLGDSAFGAYVGAGVGASYNQTHATGPNAGVDGANWGAAGALMTGLTYDMGNMVADLGYRMIYMPQITNGDAAVNPYYVNQAIIHEVRGSLRYRFN
jgi:hypothetical protein